MFLYSSASCRDGHYATSGACLYRPLKDRNTHHMSNGCALSRTVSRWAIPDLMCVARYYAGPSVDWNTQLYAQYYTMYVLFQNPVAIGGIQPQVCVYSIIQWIRTTQYYIVFMCFPEPRHDEPCPAPGVCVSTQSINRRRNSIICCVCVLFRALS